LEDAVADLRADLVLEGGGVKGIGLVGAIAVLEERGYSFNRVAGTSAGAIVGSLVAAGFSGKELADIMSKVDYRKFRDGGRLERLGRFGHAMSLVFEQGVYKGNYLKEWLGEQLGAKKITSFSDLKLLDPNSTLPAAQQYKLVVMTSDISNGELRRLPWDYDNFGLKCDDALIVEAVRSSMSIPFFYAPLKMKAGGGEECWFVDGGMLSNFPIDVFDRTDGAPPRWPTFGIKLSARPTANQGVAHRIKGTLSLTQAMIGTMTGFYDRMHINDPSALVRTIFVDTMKVRATDFGIDAQTQQQLYDNGRKAAEQFLDGAPGLPAWNWDSYLATYGTRHAVEASTKPA
jgi:NTE family protein